MPLKIKLLLDGTIYVVLVFISGITKYVVQDQNILHLAEGQSIITLTAYLRASKDALLKSTA